MTDYLAFPYHCVGNSLCFIEFQTECGVGDTFDPTIVLRAGCPYTPTWDLGDGIPVYGLSISKSDFADAGPHTIRLFIPNIAYWLTEIDVFADKIVGDFLGAIDHCISLTKIVTGDNTNLASDLSSLVGLTALTTLELREHQLLLVGDISNLAGLTNLTYIYCAGTGIYGDIASLNTLTSLTYLDLHSNAVGTGIHGDLADIHDLTSLSLLQLGNTFVTGEMADLNVFTSLGVLQFYSSGGPGTGLLTGSFSDIPALDNLSYIEVGGSDITGGTLAHNPKSQYVLIEDLGWNEATVDAFLAALYTNRASYTGAVYVPHYLRIYGTNAAPSGVYQNDATPSTGLEYVYKLCNDPDTEGFVKWHIIYTGGDKP